MPPSDGQAGVPGLIFLYTKTTSHKKHVDDISDELRLAGQKSKPTLCAEQIKIKTKTAETIKMPFEVMTWVGPMHHVLDGGSDPPRRRCNFGRENIEAHCKVMGNSAVHCAKTTE